MRILIALGVIDVVIADRGGRGFDGGVGRRQHDHRQIPHIGLRLAESGGLGGAVLLIEPEHDKMIAASREA
jgi:hypothetical protein